MVKATNITIILSNSVASVPVFMNEKTPAENKTYLFIPVEQRKLRDHGSTYVHITNCNFLFVYVRNATNKPVKILSNTRIKTLSEYSEEGCYQVDLQYHKWATRILSALDESVDKDFH